MPGVPDDAAGLGAGNARLRELLAERDGRIGAQDAEIAVLREALAGLQSQVADLAARVKSSSRNSSKPPSSDGLAKTTGHQMLTLLCGCGCETKAGAPGGVTAPVQYGPRLMGTGICLWHGQFLSRDRACRALAEMFGCAPSPGALAAAAKKTAGLLAPALKAITEYLAGADVVHSGETGFRTAGKLAWVHSASWDKYVLVTVHAKRGKDGMKAAGVLPFFTGIAVHDAWKPYDTFENVAGHALCGAHVLRELVAVTETGTDLDKAWAQQAIDALLALDKAAGAARAAGEAAVGPEILEKHEDWYRKAAATGIALSTGRHGKLQQKRHALAKRMQDREDDYLPFPRIPPRTHKVHAPLACHDAKP